MKNKIVRSDSGQGMVEYGLILALVSVVSIGALTGVGDGVKDKFEQVTGALRGEGVTESSLNDALYSEDELNKLITEEGRIPIASAEDLDKLRDNKAQTFGAGTKWESEYISGLDKEYIQVSDIDLSGNDNFEPIGNNDNRFTGKYDGGGYEINNLTINRPSENNVGLFGWTDGSRIENVGLNNLVVKGDGRVGGLIGHQDHSSTMNSYASGKVTGNNQVGGLIGQQYNSSTTKNSYASGSVSGEGNFVGGLIGYQDSSSSINSYVSGSVSGEGNNVGGLIGYQWGSSSKTENSYASGEVTGNSRVGGLMGHAQNGSINNSGWNKDVNDNGIGQNDSASVTNVNGHTTEEINEIIKDLIK